MRVCEGLLRIYQIQTITAKRSNVRMIFASTSKTLSSLPDYLYLTFEAPSIMLFLKSCAHAVR